ncbi:PucC family protein [Halovulum dunhuangense]|uniref:PucC family protein n=1 Tax=Halovulum dunhuangense TaxID=1505036 RepID=A0A849L069_9RHOB|nr:PucC family protein [Halovulum dunhuangense]NNU79370.1 PucC family protein [Halovulum dunhuangense]
MSKERHPLTRFTLEMLPFADAASDGLPLRRLLRLSLFQVSVGMATVLLLGTLNRVMIVELSVPAMLVALMIALPVLSAPFRALLGFRSDTHRSAIGWRRVPYLWFGSLYQFGGLAIMPFALILLSGDQTHGPAWAGEVIAAVAFLMTGLGLHMTQTAGLALASDQATDETRPRVVALLYVMFLAGMAVSALLFGLLLADFSKLRLIQVVQGAAVVTLALNLVALWKQEKMSPMSRAERERPRPPFRAAWADLMAGGQAGRLLLVVALGTCAFSMQDVLLEPYGGEVLGLSVAATTVLTALWALGALAGFALAGRWLSTGRDPARLAAAGCMAGVVAFSAVVFSAPMAAPALYFTGAFGIGFGAGLFGVATLIYAMAMPKFGTAGAGLALGAWGAAQATAAGVGIALGGTLRDGFATLAQTGSLGPAFSAPHTGYTFVYHLEIGLLFLTLVAIGPLVRTGRVPTPDPRGAKLGLAEFPS